MLYRGANTSRILRSSIFFCVDFVCCIQVSLLLMVHTMEYKNCSTRLICVLNARLVIAFYRETNFEEISGINTKNVLLYIILYIFKNDGLYCMVSCVYVIFQKRETKLNYKHLLDKLTNRRVKEGTKETVKL